MISRKNGTRSATRALDFGQRLGAARRARGWSRAELARRTGDLTAEGIRRIEQGLTHNPGILHAQALAWALDVPLPDLLGPHRPSGGKDIIKVSSVLE